MKDKIIPYILGFLSFLVRKVLFIDILLVGIVVLSFLGWGQLTTNSLSERLIWTGIGIALVAGILVSAQTTGGRDYGLPGQFVRSAHTQDLIKL